MPREQLTNNLQETLNWALSQNNVVENNTPYFIQEILKWGQISYIFYIMVSLLLLIVSLFWVVWVIKRANKDLGVGPEIVFPSISCIVTSLTLFSNLYYYLFVTFSPRLYVIDQLQMMLK
jgi:hypothetical protein